MCMCVCMYVCVCEWRFAELNSCVCLLGLCESVPGCTDAESACVCVSKQMEFESHQWGNLNPTMHWELSQRRKWW